MSKCMTQLALLSALLCVVIHHRKGLASAAAENVQDGGGDHRELEDSALCSLSNSLFGTGQGADGKLIPVPLNATSPQEIHWAIYKPMSSNPLAVPPMVLADGEVPLGWLQHADDPTTSSQWISALSQTTILYRFDQTFTIPSEADLSTVKIQGQFAASYAVLAILLNGNETLYAPQNAITGYTPGTLGGLFTLPPLTQQTNTLSIVVISRAPKKKAFLNVWFPIATYASTTSSCGSSSTAPASTRKRHHRSRLTKVEVESMNPTAEDRLQRGLFAYAEAQIQRQTAREQEKKKLAAAAATTASSQRRRLTGPTCSFLINSTGDGDESWTAWYRSYDPAATKGPLTPTIEMLANTDSTTGEQVPGLISISQANASNWFYYTTTINLPTEANLSQGVLLQGVYNADYAVQSIVLNGKTIWSNTMDLLSGPSAYAYAKHGGFKSFSIGCSNSGDESVSDFIQDQGRWTLGSNTLAFVVLANPAKAYRTAFQTAFNFAGFSTPDPTFCPEGTYRIPSAIADDDISILEEDDDDAAVIEEAFPAPALPEAVLKTCSAGCRPLGTANISEDGFVKNLAVDSNSQIMYLITDATPAYFSRYSLTNGSKLNALSAQVQLDAPAALAIGTAGEVYVLEATKVRAFDPSTGAALATYGPLTSALGLAVLPLSNGKAWLYTIENSTVKAFNADSNATTAPIVFPTCWTGDQSSCLVQPIDLAISFNVSASAGSETPDPTVFVLDAGTQQVIMFSPTGGFLGSMGGPGMFDDPTSISVDPFRGLIYAVDYGSNNVKVLDRRGNIWHTLGNTVDECGYFKQSFFPNPSVINTPAPQTFDQGAEVGIKIRSTRPGNLTAVRFYKAVNEIGSHTATVWSSDGQALSTVVFDEPANSTLTGWQTAYLSQPLALNEDTDYVVSVGINQYAVGMDNGGQTDQRLYTGKDLFTSGTAGGLLGPAVGHFPTVSTTLYSVDVEFITAPPQLKSPFSGAVSTIYNTAQAQNAVFYLNQASVDSNADSVLAFRCSGYPMFAGDCNHHLDGLDASVTTDLKTTLQPSKVIGFNFWGATYSLRSDIDYLSEGASIAAETGSETIGVFMSGELPASDIYTFNSPLWPSSSSSSQPTSLTELAQLPYYDNLFKNPQIKTYVINAYSVATRGIGFRLRHSLYSADDATAETQEFADLTSYLLKTFEGTGKTFILQAWGLDTFLANAQKTEIKPTWASSAAVWLRARQAGVEAGRNATVIDPTSVAVYHSVQVNRGVVDKSQGLVTPWAVDRLLPNVTVDLVGWSAYEASRKLDPSNVGRGIDALNTAIRPSVQASYALTGLKYPDAGGPNSRVYIAEIGDNDARLYGEPEAAKMLLPGAIKEAVDKNCPVVLLWAAYNGNLLETADFRPWTEIHEGYWLKRPDGSSAFGLCYLKALQAGG